MTSFQLKQKDLQPRWWLVDAEGVILGRLAAQIATILRGKHRPTFTPHLQCGDCVVVINADKVKVTGNKLRDKIFHYHTGYPGGIKDRPLGQRLAGRFPERVLEKAVERMMPRGPLGREQMRNLKVYAGAEHPHTAQSPERLDIAGRNPKNKRTG